MMHSDDPTPDKTLLGCYKTQECDAIPLHIDRDTDWKVEHLNSSIQSISLRAIIDWYIYSLCRPTQNTFISHNDFEFSAFLHNNYAFVVPEPYFDMLDKFHILQSYKLFIDLQNELEQLAIIDGLCIGTRQALGRLLYFFPKIQENIHTTQHHTHSRIIELNEGLRATLSSLPGLARYWHLNRWLHAKSIAEIFSPLQAEDYATISPLLNTKGNTMPREDVPLQEEFQHIATPINILSNPNLPRNLRDEAYTKILGYMLGDIFNEMCLNIGVLETLQNPTLQNIIHNIQGSHVWMLVLYFTTEIPDVHLKKSLQHPIAKTTQAIADFFDTIESFLQYLLSCILYCFTKIIDAIFGPSPIRPIVSTHTPITATAIDATPPILSRSAHTEPKMEGSEIDNSPKPHK